MKTKLTLLAGALTFLVCSCTNLKDLEKRRYRPGFYWNAQHVNPTRETVSVEGNSSQKNNNVVVLQSEKEMDLDKELSMDGLKQEETKTVQHKSVAVQELKHELPAAPPDARKQGDDDQESAEQARFLAILAIVCLFLFFPAAIVLAIIAITKAKAILEKHPMGEDFSGKSDANFALTAGKVVLGAACIIVIAFFLLLLVLINLANSSGCYIATMVYKSYDAPEVLVLRRFRDEKLKTNFFGRLFIVLYYTFSPIFVRAFQNNATVNAFCKRQLDRLVKRLSEKDVQQNKSLA